MKIINTRVKVKSASRKQENYHKSVLLAYFMSVRNKKIIILSLSNHKLFIVRYLFL